MRRGQECFFPEGHRGPGQTRDRSDVEMMILLEIRAVELIHSSVEEGCLQALITVGFGDEVLTQIMAAVRME